MGGREGARGGVRVRGEIGQGEELGFLREQDNGSIATLLVPSQLMW